MLNIWQGKLVKLRAVEPVDWEAFYTFDEDAYYGRYDDTIVFPASQESIKKWVAELATADVKNDEYRWVIENLAGEFVGTINSHHCDPRVGAFEYGVAIRREHWRNGYAAEAIQLVLSYFFNELRYQKVCVIVYDFNEASLALHQKLGFQHEGRMRRMGFTDGKYFDHILLGMTREEFNNRQPTANS